MLLTMLQIGFVLGDSDLAVATESAFLWGIKFLFVLAGILYILFGFIVTRQINIMRKTLITSFSPLLSVLGWIHLAVAAGFLLFVLLLPT